ncbi:uncharacterized protein V1510DRAFT_371365 [Dipodascopsis tothii]|uniref:uncharacterized protein n=1 Tax=Dipodascopsis tothii TaxID=44089 RepID=UPI0034CEA599
MAQAIQALIPLATSPTAAEDLVKRALETPDMYVFSDMLRSEQLMGNLAQAPDGAGYGQLLRIFAAGTWADYKAIDGLPALTAGQAYKLRQLTLASLAAETHVLPYATLLGALDLAAVTELEDLVIKAIYANLISAKLDTKNQQLHATPKLGRGLTDSKTLDDLCAVLDRWIANVEGVIGDLGAQQTAVRDRASSHARDAAEYNAEVERINKLIAARPETSTPGPSSGRDGSSLLTKLIAESRKGERAGSSSDSMDIDDDAVTDSATKKRKYVTRARPEAP